MGMTIILCSKQIGLSIFGIRRIFVRQLHSISLPARTAGRLMLCFCVQKAGGR